MAINVEYWADCDKCCREWAGDYQDKEALRCDLRANGWQVDNDDCLCPDCIEGGGDDGSNGEERGYQN